MTEQKRDEKFIILITGANKGVGFGAARALGKRGHTVLVGCRDADRGAAAVASLVAEGIDAEAVRLDVTDEVSVDDAARQINGDHHRLDILINNAGITLDRPHGPTDLPIRNLRAVYETNVFGVVAVTNAMLPLLRRSAAATIGNVSSGLGSLAYLSDPESPLWEYANLLAYNSSKSALNAITLIYAHELKDAGITVNALSPGFVATDLNHHTGQISSDEAGERIAKQVLQRTENGVFLSEFGGTYPW